MLCQTAHHSHIDPDDLAIPDLYITGMGICMKEAVIHDLLDIVINQFASDLFQVVSVLNQCIFVIDPESVDVLHDKHIDRCILLVENRSAHKADLLIPAGKFFHICRFCKEIHLIPCHRPHFIQHKVQIRHSLDTDRRHQLYSLVKKVDISCHLLVNPFTLDLYDYIFSAFKDCPVHLCNRSRALWLLFYGRKYPLP